MALLRTRLDEARENSSSTMSQVGGTFLRSFSTGLTGDWTDEPDIPEMEEGWKKTVTGAVGRIGGAITTMTAMEAGIAAGVAALGGGVVAAPLLLGTISALAYTAFQNADIKTKLIEGTIGLATAGVASKLGLGKLKFVKAPKTEKAAEVIAKAQAHYEIGDITRFSEVKEELMNYAIKNKIQSNSYPTILANAISDFHLRAGVSKRLPKTFEKLAQKDVIGDDGIVKDSYLNLMKLATDETKTATRQVLETAATEAGIQNKLAMDATYWGKIKKGIKEQVYEPLDLMAEFPHGGEVGQMADKSSAAFRAVLDDVDLHFEGVSSKIKKIDKSKNPSEVWGRISDVLDGQKGIDTLKTADERDIYQAYKDAYKYYRPHAVKWKVGQTIKNPAEAEAATRRINSVLDDVEDVSILKNDTEKKIYEEYGREYFTHVKKTLGDVKGTLAKFVPEELQDGFLNERVGGLKEWSKDVPRVFNRYSMFMSKKLAWEPTIDKFRELGSHPGIAKYLAPMLRTDRVEEPIADFIGKMRFTNLVRHNPFSAMTNRSQSFAAKATLSPEAIAVLPKLEKINDPKILNFLNAKFSHQYEDAVKREIGTSRGVVKKALEKTEFFFKSEKRNWFDSRAMGLTEELVQSSKFQDLMKAKTPIQDALFKTLQDENVWQRGITRGADLARSRQFGMEQGFKSPIFETTSKMPTLRLMAQFQRFGVSQFLSVMNLFRQEGKLMDISRRGLQDQVSVVERLKAMRVTYNGAKIMAKTATGEQKAALSAFRQELKEDMGYLVEEINRIEPRTKLSTGINVSKMIATGTVPKLARAWLKWGLVGWAFNKAVTPEKKVSDVGTIAAGQIPGLEFVRGYDLNPVYKDPKYGMVSTITSIIPGVGLLDTTIPGRPITRAAYNLWKGEKKPKKSKKTTRFRPM